MDMHLFVPQHNQDLQHGNEHRYGPGKVMLQVDSSLFMRMVVAACYTVLKFHSPHSRHKVSALVSNPYRAAAEEFTSWSQTQIPRLNGQEVYLTVQAGIELLVQYANWRNDNPECALVGQEYWTNSLTYEALLAFHEYKCSSIERAFLENGMNWGTATGWNKTDYSMLVLHWPKRYDFPALKNVSVLPSKQPDYEERRQLYMASQRKDEVTFTGSKE